MIGKASNSSIKPLALGTTLQSSTYGQTINVILGRTKCNLILTWEANVRQTSGKKGKPPLTKKKKGAQAQYSANVDFLIGHNPIMSPLQFWVNQSQKLPLKFTSYTASPSVGTDFLTIPDPNFYAVLGVTVPASYSDTFNDYGSPTGSIGVSGTWNIPLWNGAYHGPDPAFPSIGVDFWAFYYVWTPAMGATIKIGRGLNGLIQPGNYTVYYAQLWPDGASQYGKKQSGTDIPASALNLTFEPILGDGPEFNGFDNISGASLANQRIYYPPYAGLGSQAYQSAQTGLPEVSAEVLGMYPLWSTGDADFCDMIRDIFQQGPTQPGFATSSDPSADQKLSTHLLQRGLGCYDWPGLIQMNQVGDISGAAEPLYYWQPNQPGNPLVLVCSGGLVGSTPVPPTSISDSAGDTWNPVPVTLDPGQVWWANAVGYAAQNVVSIGNGGTSWQAACFELGGVDTFDASATTSSGNTVSITTSNAAGTPAFIIAFADYATGVIGTTTQQVIHWKAIIAEGLKNANAYMVYTRVVWQPGTYSFTAPTTEITGENPIRVTLVAFKLADPPSYPKPLGDILDHDSMALTRAQDRAYGLYGSLLMDSQQKASDWLDTVYQAANAAPVWSGFKLKSIPYAEASAAGNGATYNAPTASGPVAQPSLSDFIYDSGQPVYSVERKAQVDVPNLLQLQIPNRGGDYNDVVISQPMTAAIALYGSRKDSPKQFRCIQDPAIARMILQVDINKQNTLRNVYKFKLVARWKLLEPMDLITLPADSTTGQSAVDVRITSVEEDENYQLNFEAEPFIYGTYVPTALDVTAQQPYAPQGGGTPGRVNAPVIFEPTPRVYGAQNQAQLWLVVSAAAGQVIATSIGAAIGTGYLVGDVLTLVQSGAAGGQVTVTSVNGGGGITGISGTITAAGKNYTPASNLATTGGTGTGAQISITQVSAGYGGCLVFISTDGGSSYNQIGQIIGNAVTGVSTGDWPIHADPDTTNDLPLDLSESDGVLASYQAGDRDNFTYASYIAGGGAPIPYELLSYNTATLTSTYNYTLKATGAGNELRRSIYGAPNAGGPGVDHPNGSRFAFLGPVGTTQQNGILKLPMDPNWVGKTLHFKFLAFNSQMSGVESLSDAVDYTYTVLGTSGNVNPAGAPAQLFQVNGL